MRTVVVVAMMLLAGCSAAPEPVTSCQGDGCEIVVEQAPEPDLPPSDYDRVQGVIIDNTYAPIAGATVTLRERDNAKTALGKATTGSDGRFAFLKVADRSYWLEVSHPKYLEAKTLVLPMVIPQSIIIPLEKIFEQPRHTMVQWDGILRCGLYTAGTLGDYGCLPLDLLFSESDDHRRTFHEEIVVPGPPAVLAQLEFVWDAGMDQSKSLYASVASKDMGGSQKSSNLGGQQSESPLIYSIPADVVDEHNIGTTDESSRGLLVNVYVGGSDGLPFGLAMDQRFTAYVSVVHGKPVPEGWAYVLDGPL